MKNLTKIVPLIALLLIAGTAFASFYPSGGSTYRLASSVGSNDTTINLSSFKEPVSGIPYTMSYLNSGIECGTLDPQNSNSEFVSFTGITQFANGSAALTGVSRGLGRSYPYTASTTLSSAHAGGSIFILSDAPCLFQQYAAIGNAETITGNWDVPFPSESNSVVPRSYVDGAAFGGIGGASESATGTVQIATGAQAAASTKNGSIGRLALPSSLSTSTWSASIPVGTIPVIGSIGGTIDSNFIGSFATSTKIGYLPAYQIALQRQIFTTTGTSTFAVPAGVTLFNVQVQGGGSNGGAAAACGGSGLTSVGIGGSGGGYANKNISLVGTSSVQVFVGTAQNWSTFGTNGFYISATGGVGTAPGTGTNGDIDIAGQPAGPGQGSVSGAVITGLGYGGGSVLGSGAIAQAGTNQVGVNGGVYGGGASGGFCSNNVSGEAGGTGAQGAVIVSW